MRRALATLLLLAIAAPGWAQGYLDMLGNRLSVVSADGQRWAQLSAMSDVTVYGFEDPPSGLLFSDDDPFVAPRLSLTADAGIGERVLVHAMLRADRGFDAGDDEGGDVRLDEVFLQVNVLDRARGRIRIGRFATAFGGWVGRHLAWDNPLVTAPALYDDLVGITDAAAPADAGVFAGRRNVPENKLTWVPVIWGPSYATGAAISLGVASFDATVEVKNAALSSRPESWNDGFDTDPTFTGRLVWHPGPEWTLGVSASDGPYLRSQAEATLSAPADVDDFAQTTFGIDFTYERHYLQVWAELVQSRFDVPGVGAADMLGGFVEVRYKPTARLWLAGRMNVSRFDEPPGLEHSWDRHLGRLDLAVGYRHSAHIQGKIQYSIGNQAGRDTNGRHLVAAQVVLWL